MENRMPDESDQVEDSKQSFGLQHQPSSDDAATSSMLSFHIQDRTQLLRLETITDTESRVCLLARYFVMRV